MALMKSCYCFVRYFYLNNIASFVVIDYKTAANFTHYYGAFTIVVEASCHDLNDDLELLSVLSV